MTGETAPKQIWIELDNLDFEEEGELVSLQNRVNALLASIPTELRSMATYNLPYEGATCLNVGYWRDETESERTERLAREQLAQIRAKAQSEEHERREFLRLKAKFEKVAQ